MQPSVVRTQPPRWPAILAATLTGAWIVLVTAVLQGLGWLVAEILIEAELGTPFWLWPAVNLANAFLALLPAILLAVLPKSPTVRAIGRLWTAAAAALAVVGLDRAVPVVHNELTLAVLAVLAAILATWARRRLGHAGAPRDRLWLGLAAGLATLLPWLWLGSLGGLTETVLAALAALAVGALAAFGPLAFVDPEETSLLLGLRDIAFWTLIAAFGSLTVGLLIGSGYALRLPAAVPSTRSVAFVTAAVALAGLAVHLTLGHPGLHGERLFVVMREQADLTGITGARPVRDRLVDLASRSQAPLRRELRRLHLSYTPYYLVNGLEVDGGPAVRAWLSRRSDVDRVLLSPRLRPLPAPAPTPRGPRAAPQAPQWNVTVLGADRVWRELGVTGDGIVVGSSDSGVDGTHPALRNGFRGGDDSWYDPWRHSRNPTDHNGHGTHT